MSGEQDDPDFQVPVFVFGSNLAGCHGKGAALFALKHRGALYGRGWGPQGNSYAIPTKDSRFRTLSLEEVEQSVQLFLRYAEQHPELTFEVTRIGCGLAGYRDEQIAPMFRGAPDNCILPKEWLPYTSSPSSAESL